MVIANFSSISFLYLILAVVASGIGSILQKISLDSIERLSLDSWKEKPFHSIISLIKIKKWTLGILLTITGGIAFFFALSEGMDLIVARPIYGMAGILAAALILKESTSTLEKIAIFLAIIGSILVKS